MGCAYWREVLSAWLDGEESSAERDAIEAHLAGCAGCRQFADHAAQVTRLARTTVATELPDVVEAVLAAAPRRRRPRLITILRLLLGVVGFAQLTIAVQDLLGAHGPGGMAMEGASVVHFAHESAAWNLALGIGFCWVAWCSSRTVGVVPTLATFVVTLTALVSFDVAAGQVGLGRLLVHVWALAGLGLVIMLDRRRPPTGGTVPGAGSRLRRRPGPVPPAPSVFGAPPDDVPGLQPSAQHSAATETARHGDSAVA